MKNKLFTLAAVSAVLFSTSALALPVIGFNPDGTGAGGGGYEYADTWNYATDRGVDVGIQGPFTPGDTHTFHSQMAINSFQLSGSTFNPRGGLNGQTTGYEITKELALSDKVATFLGSTVTFSAGEDLASTLNIYIDYFGAGDASKSDGGTGVGNVSCYGGPNVCGVGTDQTGAITQTGGPGETGAILTAHMLSISSSFTASAPGAGTGSFQVLWKIDSHDARYIDLSNLGGALIFADLMDGTLTQPATQFPDHMWDGTSTAGADKQVFDVTGRQVFQTAVPEPSSLALLGAAGLFLSAFSRRKKA